MAAVALSAAPPLAIAPEVPAPAAAADIVTPDIATATPTTEAGAHSRPTVLQVEVAGDDVFEVSVGPFTRCGELLSFAKTASALPYISELATTGVDGGIARLQLKYEGRIPLARYLADILPVGRIADLKGSAKVQPLILVHPS
ncbi:MAG: hypothetical protein IT307_11980 [Chloroflexi bacterium]|nr:hypothetical protein [Chloroflexota bacterium]